jgi:hypothetical protein
LYVVKAASATSRQQMAVLLHRVVFRLSVNVVEDHANSSFKALIPKYLNQVYNNILDFKQVYILHQMPAYFKINCSLRNITELDMSHGMYSIVTGDI